MNGGLNQTFFFESSPEDSGSVKVLASEITDTDDSAGWVCFDAECRLCTNLAQRLAPLLGRYQLALVPLQTPWVQKQLAGTDNQLLSEMRLLTKQGDVYGGADALIAIALTIWWSRPLYWLSHVPAVTPLLWTAYRLLARHRTCLGGRCRISTRSKRISGNGLIWIPAVTPVVIAAALGKSLSGFVWMWVIALALFLGAKWVTISKMWVTKESANRSRLLAYSFLWPGMDVRTFCGNTLVPVPPIREWTLAIAKTLFGAVLIWVVVRLVGTTHPWITGWVGMIGIIFLIHFGLFHLLSLFWRARGINARPIMESPGTASSLSQFWGRRWNAAFSVLMRDYVFKPLIRQFGAVEALITIFLISGALHELVISIPAHGGYGLPTAYFILQSLGILFEHSKPGRALGIGSGWKGWCFVVLVAGLPAPCLFHTVFIYNVILPMLRAVGAT